MAVEIKGVIEQYIGQLKTSGYSRKQSKEIVVCGVVGWRRKLERREKQYLEAKDTLEKRTEDKLLEKSTWYKGNQKRKLENKNSKFQYNPPAKKRRKCQQEPGQRMDKAEDKKKVKAVMCVPYTAHSELAARLRENEEKMQGMTGYKLKIVEKGGTKLVDKGLGEILEKICTWNSGSHFFGSKIQF